MTAALEWALTPLSVTTRRQPTEATLTPTSDPADFGPRYAESGAGDLHGKTAVVTGASRGIGLAIASSLVRRGASVCVTARKPEELERAVALLDPDGLGRAVAIPGRSDDPEHQKTALSIALDKFGSLDVLVNNAAVNPYFGELMNAPIDAVRKILEVNVVAVLTWTQTAWEMWLASHGGCVLNVASIGGLVPGPSLGAYNVSKAALIHLTRQLAQELAPKVRVNAVAPAVVKTQFSRALYETNEEPLTKRYPLQRLGEPIDIGHLAGFLVSDEAAWITGQTITIDGGISIASLRGDGSPDS